LAVGALHRGNQQLALAHFELALALYDRADHRSPVCSCRCLISGSPPLILSP
jgi:hypothetical protein